VVKTMGKKTAKADRKVSLRLTEEQEDALDDIVHQRGYKNRSSAIRDALERFIEDSKESFNTEKITIELSKVYVTELDKLLDFIGASTRSEAIRMAIRQYLQNENEFLLKQTLEYEELRAKYRKSVYRPKELEP